jgi:hypothetical protein
MSEATVAQYMNYAPPNLTPEKDLPKGFIDFLLPLHKQFTPRQQKLVAKRAQVLEASHRPATKLSARLRSHHDQLANRDS